MEDFKIKYKFLHTKPIKQKQIAQKMYADEFQSINNRQNVLDFFKRVAEDGRFEELAMELGLINCQTITFTKENKTMDYEQKYKEALERARELKNKLEKQGKRNNIVEQLTAFAQHLNKRGAFRDDLCMDFEHEAESFIESQKYNAKQKEL